MHHTGGRYESAAAEMDAILGLKHTELRSYRCHLGKTAEITEK